MSFYQCFFGVSTYKSKQGVLIRRLFQFVCAMCGLGLALNVARFSPDGWMVGFSSVYALVLFTVVLWLSWRITQYPAVCDFLIDVQVESRRVSWSRFDVVKRSTMVVLSVMFALSVYLFLCDVVLQFLLRSAFVLNF